VVRGVRRPLGSCLFLIRRARRRAIARQEPLFTSPDTPLRTQYFLRRSQRLATVRLLRWSGSSIRCELARRQTPKARQGSYRSISAGTLILSAAPLLLSDN